MVFDLMSEHFHRRSWRRRVSGEGIEHTKHRPGKRQDLLMEYFNQSMAEYQDNYCVHNVKKPLLKFYLSIIPRGRYYYY